MSEVELLKEVEDAHLRIEGLKERIMNLEHYIGLRSHSFDGYRRQYDFHQIKKDMVYRNRPQSLFEKRKAKQDEARPFQRGG
jgi:hypothetical protein